MEYVCPNRYAGSLSRLNPARPTRCAWRSSTRTAAARGVPSSPPPDRYQSLRQGPDPARLSARWSGPRLTPAFTGLMLAYAEAKPGDMILVMAAVTPRPPSRRRRVASTCSTRAARRTCPSSSAAPATARRSSRIPVPKLFCALRGSYNHIENIAVEGKSRMPSRARTTRGASSAAAVSRGMATRSPISPREWTPIP